MMLLVIEENGREAVLNLDLIGYLAPQSDTKVAAFTERRSHITTFTSPTWAELKARLALRVESAPVSESEVAILDADRGPDFQRIALRYTDLPIETGGVYSFRHVQFPILLAPRSDGFWQTAERQDDDTHVEHVLDIGCSRWVADELRRGRVVETKPADIAAAESTPAGTVRVAGGGFLVETA